MSDIFLDVSEGNRYREYLQALTQWLHLRALLPWSTAPEITAFLADRKHTLHQVALRELSATRQRAPFAANVSLLLDAFVLLATVRRGATEVPAGVPPRRVYELDWLIAETGSFLGWSELDKTLGILKKDLQALAIDKRHSQKVITVDGPACSGKGYLADAMRWLGFAYMDTGMLYRMVAYRMIRRGLTTSDERKAGQVAREVVAELHARHHEVEAILRRPLRSLQVAQEATLISRHNAVRDALTEYSRYFARHPPKQAFGAILDGRDAGSVICPEASVKIYVGADTNVRAACTRKYMLHYGDDSISIGDLHAYISRRDAMDRQRTRGPLVIPRGAHILDITSVMSHGSTYEGSFPVGTIDAPNFVQLVQLKYRMLEQENPTGVAPMHGSFSIIRSRGEAR
ncbi:MAG TPA: (d)CMP kinase [Thermoanaerobaculia bacterium]